jgi:biotin transporter BioY
MDIAYSALLVLHFIGLAAIVGSFLVQMRRKSDFSLTWMLIGAITQVVTGLGLVGLAEASDYDVNYPKIIVKLVIAVIVLVAAVAAVLAQRKGNKVQPFFHTAGGLAIINILLAVFWQ